MADDLDPNAADRWAAFIRQAGSLAPTAGPVAAELLTQVIPRQRMDRVVEHIRRMDHRLQVIEAKTAGARGAFERNARSEYGTAIIEDSVIQSARTVEPESRERIAALVVRSLTEQDLQHERTRKLLNLYSELLYPEVIWLLYFAFQSRRVSAKTDHGEKFASKHSGIINDTTIPRPSVVDKNGELRGLARFVTDDEETAVNKSYIATLVRLELLEKTESRIISSYQITSLGALVVRHIELESDTPSQKSRGASAAKG